MKKVPGQLMTHEMPLTDAEFLASFNKNMPAGYPHVSLAILKRFKDAHLSMFKPDGLWSLDHHRKRMIEWLPQNI
jgi:hypothetical protein